MARTGKKKKNSGMRSRKDARTAAEIEGPPQRKNQHADRRFQYAVAVTVAILAIVVGFSVLQYQDYQHHQRQEQELRDTSQRQEQELRDTSQILSYPDFPISMRPNVRKLEGHPPDVQYLAAERVLKMYPQCVPCLYSLSTTAKDLLGFEEAVEASARLLDLVPDNHVAIGLHKSNVEDWDMFKKLAQQQQENFLRLPDDRVHHRWAPFAELPENHAALAHSTSISDLQEMWRAVKFQDPTLARDIIEIIQRQWAVETGRVENLYVLSEGATQSLITHGISMNAITSDPERSLGIREGTEDVGAIEDIILDQKKVIEALSQRIVDQSINITKDLVIELQLAFTATARFTDSQSDSGRIKLLVHRGSFKNQPNYPQRSDGRVHQYCPYTQVDEEVLRLLKLLEKYQEQEDVATEVLAAWLHHRFVQIHPFHDGNGRVARSVTTLVLMKAGLLPFTVRLRDRRQYINAIEKANKGDLGPFVSFIVQQQRETLLTAISLSGHRAGRILSSFEHKLHAVDLPDLHKFAEVIEAEIEAVVETFAVSSNSGKVVRELTAANWTKKGYEEFGFVVPSDGKEQRRVVWELPDARLLFYVLQLHPRGWGIFVAVGIIQLDGESSGLFDGEWFPFSSTALQSQTESKEAIKSWLRHHLSHGFANN